MTTSRRHFLRQTALLGTVAALSACTISTTGNTTTITLNVAKVAAYAKAAENFGTTILAVSVISAALGPETVAIIEALDTAIASAMSAINTAAGGAISVSYDNTSVKTAFDTILADFQKVLNYAQTAASSVTLTGEASKISDVTVAISAAETIISLMQAMISTSVSTPRAARRMMPESTALNILHQP